MGNDSVKKTLLVAFILCVFFSVIVSSFAVGLRPYQKKNRELDMKKNILSAAGLNVSGESEIQKAFSKVQTLYVEIPSGNILELSSNDKRLKERVKIPASEDVASLGYRAKYLPVYLIKEGGEVKSIVLPIVSKGLWSTMYAFMALGGDGDTIEGLEYYRQGETPGLGAEITNPKWKALWKNKKVYRDGKVAISIVKPGRSVDKSYHIDGISGATLTVQGVDHSLKYWLGENGFQNLLSKISGGQL